MSDLFFTYPLFAVPYHPVTNGAFERENVNLVSILHKMASSDPSIGPLNLIKLLSPTDLATTALLGCHRLRISTAETLFIHQAFCLFHLQLILAPLKQGCV